jgi:hypothetical protein
MPDLERFVNDDDASAFDLLSKMALIQHQLEPMRDEAAWKPWVLHMLQAVAEIACITLALVKGIRSQMADVKHRMRPQLPKIYSRDLYNNLFRFSANRLARGKHVGLAPNQHSYSVVREDLMRGIGAPCRPCLCGYLPTGGALYRRSMSGRISRIQGAGVNVGGQGQPSDEPV